VTKGSIGILALGLDFGPRPPEVPRPVAPDVKFVDANGIRFAYLERGHGPLVLLFHGYPETARSWNVVQDRLAAAGYRVVAPFMRGFPPSGFAADGNYTVKALGEDVVALIDALGERNAIVVGHDWGASAVYAAATGHPDKIAKLVAISIPHPRGINGDLGVLAGAPHFVYYQLPWSRRIVWSHNFAHVARLYALWAPNYHAPPPVLDDIEGTLNEPGALDGALGYYWSFFKGGPSNAGAPPNSTLSAPALIVAGSADGGLRPDYFDKARPAFTGQYRFIEYDGVGHFPQLEAPDRLSDDILTFIGKP
jgi:pimeloyl-ACP methyl ester carboxylesterase